MKSLNNIEDPVIDVLFPYYGDIELMKKAVLSILSQSYENWILKVFDDGYPSDEPESFFIELIEKECQTRTISRIIYEKNEQNLGANGNYRKALDNVTSDYYVMMGADDIMHPDFLATFISTLKIGKTFDMYHPMVDIIDENDQSYFPMADRVKRWVMPKESGLYKGEKVAESYIKGWHYFPAVIWKTESAKAVGFNPDYDTIQDVCQGLDILQRGGTIYLDKEHETFSYRRHSHSDSSDKAITGQRFIQEKMFYVEKEREFRKMGWGKAARVAKHHTLSRLNSLTYFFQALFSPKGNVKEIIKHVFNLDG